MNILGKFEEFYLQNISVFEYRLLYLKIRFDLKKIGFEINKIYTKKTNGTLISVKGEFINVYGKTNYFECSNSAIVLKIPRRSHVEAKEIATNEITKEAFKQKEKIAQIVTL